MSDKSPYDAVVIGSGLGGLTAAACLAHEGKRVCLIERHRSLGGCASTYKTKGGLTIEASLHQTADPHDGHDPKCAVLERLGILDQLDWVRTGPVYEARGGPLGDEPFVLENGFDTVRHAFRSRFPASSAGTTRVLDAMEGVVDALGNLLIARETHSLFTLAHGLAGLGPLIGGWRKSLDAVFDHELGSDEAAKYALAANMPYYGDDASKLWWLYFAVAQGGLIRSGGTFVKGGSSRLSIKLARVVKQAGGDVLMGRVACGIDIDPDGTITGVRHRGGAGAGDEDRVATNTVLANCAPDVAAGMLPDEWGNRLAAAYEGLEPSNSVFSIHYGLKKPVPATLPAVYSTLLLPDWMTTLADYAEAGALLGALPIGRLPPFAVVNYAAIDSGFDQDELSLVTVTGVDRLSNWAGLSKEEEHARRNAWTAAITERLEREYPGFAAAIGETSFSSARSLRNYIGTPGGAIYGFAMTPPAGPVWSGIGRSPKTVIPGLFLASAFAGSGGFSGAIGSGEGAAAMASRWLDGLRRR